MNIGADLDTRDRNMARPSSALDARPRKKKKKRKRQDSSEGNPYASLNVSKPKVPASEMDTSTIGGDHETDSIVYRVDSIQKFVDDDLDMVNPVNDITVQEIQKEPEDGISRDYVAQS